MKKLLIIMLSITLFYGSLFGQETMNSNADSTKYVKANFGFRDGIPLSYGFIHYTTGYFNFEPTFGFNPKKNNQNFVLELALKMNIKKNELEEETRKQKIFIPSITALYYFTPEKNYSVFLGAGIGAPFGKIIDFSIEESEQENYMGFTINFTAGCQWKIGKHAGLDASLNVGILEFLSWGFDAGLIYRF